MTAPFIHPALQTQRRPDALERAVADLRRQATITARRLAESRAAVVAAGARVMVRQPWRIVPVVCGHASPWIWPVDGKAATELLAECARRIAGNERRRDEHHWTYDPNEHIALEQAEFALIEIITAEPAA